MEQLKAENSAACGQSALTDRLGVAAPELRGIEVTYTGISSNGVSCVQIGTCVTGSVESTGYLPDEDIFGTPNDKVSGATRGD